MEEAGQRVRVGPSVAPGHKRSQRGHDGSGGRLPAEVVQYLPGQRVVLLGRVVYGRPDGRERVLVSGAVEVGRVARLVGAARRLGEHGTEPAGARLRAATAGRSRPQSPARGGR